MYFELGPLSKYRLVPCLERLEGFACESSPVFIGRWGTTLLFFKDSNLLVDSGVEKQCQYDWSGPIDGA